MLTVQLLHLGDPSQTPVEERSFEGGRMTIGRGGNCDWRLDDQARSISKLHCELFNRGMQVFVTDHSTNGTYLNQAHDRLTVDAPVAVEAGDTLRLGGFILALKPHHDGADDFNMDDGPAIRDAGVFDDWERGDRVEHQITDRARASGIDNLIGDIGHLKLPDDDPTPLASEPGRGRGALSTAFSEPILSEFALKGDEGMIPENWDLDRPDAPLDAHPPEPLPKSVVGGAIPDDGQPASSPTGQEILGEDFLSAVNPDPVPLGGAAQDAEPGSAPQPLTEQSPPAATSPNVPVLPGGHDGDRAVLAAFLEGAGLDMADFADDDPVAVMHKAGGVYRQAVLNLADILRDRSFLKNEFRIERTLIGAEANNPLKFCDPQDAAVKLLKPPERGFLDGVKAVLDAGQDIKKHQIAVLGGVRVSLKALLDRFKPATIMKGGGQDKAGFRLMGGEGERTKRAWEKFQTLHDTCQEEASKSADSFLSRAFRRGYEEQIEKLEKP